MRICQLAACTAMLAIVPQVQGRAQRRSPRRIQDYAEDDGRGWPRVELGRVKPCKTQACKAAPTITETLCTTVTDMKVIWTTETSTTTIIEEVWVTEYGEVPVSRNRRHFSISNHLANAQNTLAARDAASAQWESRRTSN